MKLIITDSIKSTNRIILRMNYSGEPTHGIEATTALNLAWQLLIEDLSKDGIVSLRLVNNNTAAAIVLELLYKNKNILSFVPEDSLCLATAAEILKNMNLLRCNSYANNGDVRVKELISFIDKYEDTLKDRDLIDAPLVLKRAVNALKTGTVSASNTDIMVCYFKKPSMLETDFVHILCANPAKFEKPLNNGKAVYSFVKTYGIVNEADYVAKTICEKKIPLGDTEIICDADVYTPYLKECFAKRGLKCNFTSGTTAAGLNMIQLYKDLINWYVGDCKYKDLFSVMHNPLVAIDCNGNMSRLDKAFLNGIAYGVGFGKDRYYNVKRPDYEASHSAVEKDIYKQFREKELPALGDLAKAIENAKKPVEVFDALFSYVAGHTFKQNLENMFTKNALTSMRKRMSAVEIPFKDKADMLEYLINEFVGLSYSQPESYDSANISDIYSPQCLERRNTFVLGLSAQEFKISVAESPVLGDDVRKTLFGAPPCGNVTLAENAVADAEQVVLDTLETAPIESFITLISSSADVMRDGSDVASSALFEKILKNKKGRLQDDTSYYEITTHDASVPHDHTWKGYTVTRVKATTLKFSKSSLDKLLKCPLDFHYSYELHINQEEYPQYDPGAWLPVNEFGTMVHRILELYAEKALKNNSSVPELFDENCKEFTEAFNQAVSEAESRNAVPNQAAKNLQLDESLAMTTKYLEELHKDLHDNGWVVFACEENLKSGSAYYDFTNNKINFHLDFSGIIDRIDKKELPDGSCVFRVIDYKTGGYHNAKQMMADTKQHLIYADYIRKEYKGNVEYFDYVYFRPLIAGETEWTTRIKGDDLTPVILSPEVDDKKGLSEQDIIHDVFVSHDYLCVAKGYKTPCMFCRYKDICLYDIV